MSRILGAWFVLLCAVVLSLAPATVRAQADAPLAVEHCIACAVVTDFPSKDGRIVDDPACQCGSVTIQQITYSPQGVDNTYASASADGRKIAFAETDSGVSTVYRAEIGASIVLRTIAAGFEPRISADGNTIVFSSDRNPVGGRGDGTVNVYLWKDGEGFTSVTATTASGGSANRSPSVNADGTKVAFVSRCNLDQGESSNCTRPPQVFRWLKNNPGSIQRITSPSPLCGSGCANADPAISGEGKIIAFSSNDDLTPNNPGNIDLNREIYLWIEGPGLQQVTNTQHGTTCGGAGDANTDNIQPSLNSVYDSVPATRKIAVAFSSRCDLTPSSPGNSDYNHEIFLYRAGWSPQPDFRQITNSQGGEGTVSTPLIANANPAVNANLDSLAIAFSSNRDLTQEGFPDSRNIFLWQTQPSVRTVRITPTGGNDNANRFPSITGDGNTVAFDSNQNLLGTASGQDGSSHNIFTGSVSSPGSGAILVPR